MGRALGAGFVCPFCDGKNLQVVNTTKLPDATDRTRVCKNCGAKIFTVEKIRSVKQDKEVNIEKEKE